MSMVVLDKVSKTFGHGHTAVNALDEVSLAVCPGEVVLVIGPSGSGKTTLLSLMGTLMRPTAGEVVIRGESVSGLPDQELARLRLQEIGFIFQTFNLLSAFTAEENVSVPLLAAGRDQRAAMLKARELLRELHLESRLNSLPRNLSGGEKQRVAIARALANNPHFILADEPTANLDTRTGHDVMELLSSLAESRRQAVIVVSHDPRLRDMATRIITIEDGKMTREEQGRGRPSPPEVHPIRRRE